mgnify:CR=1 FL=1
MRLVLVVLLLAGCGGKNSDGPDPCTECERIGPSTRFARLTHRQYDLSVQDALGVDQSLHLSDSFIGDVLSEGGFDNDGDQLQVGSELWTDYQRAAETAAAWVIAHPDVYATVVTEDPRGGVAGVDFEALIEAESDQVTTTTGGPHREGWNVWSRGTLSTTVTLSEAGTYRVSTRVWADQAGPDLAMMELRVDGEVIAAEEVQAVAFAGAEEISAEVDLSPGDVTLSVAFLNDYNGDDGDRNLYVDWVAIEGAAPAWEGPLPGDDELRAWIARFGARIHRRPLTDDQVDAYLDLAHAGADLAYTGDPFKDGVYTVLTAMFQSPWFVYRTELATEQDKGGRIPLDAWDLASKLSFALIHAPPDASLRAAAADGSLLSDEVFAEHADRLLASPRADGAIDHFHHQLLQLDSYDNIYKDPDAFPAWSPELNVRMQDEALAFTRSVVRDDEGVRDFFTAPRTYVDRDLAPLYGLAIDSDTLVPVDLDAAQRAGVLTLSGFLSTHAHASEIDSIHRGAFINLRYLCAKLPPPPDMVPPLPDPIPGQTNRERVDSHTGPGTCGGACHSGLINPVGFAFENYGPLGQWRDTDVGKPVDASGSYAFSQGQASWTGPVDFAALVADSPDAHTCLVRNWVRYVHGRETSEEDEIVVAELAERSLSQDEALAVVIREIVLDDAFRFRAPEVTR